MMEIHFHPRGQTEQKKKQRRINQNYADPLFVVGFHSITYSQLHPRFPAKIQARGYLPTLIANIGFKTLMPPSVKMKRLPWPWTSAASANQGWRGHSCGVVGLSSKGVAM